MTSASCSPALTSYNWTYVGTSDPCSLSLSYLQVCNSSATLPPLTATGITSQYQGPAQGNQADPCVCSPSFYNLLSACTACQDQGGIRRWPLWTNFTQNCPAAFLQSSGPSSIPTTLNQSIPTWAHLDPSNYLNDTWSPSLAYSISQSSVILPSKLTSSVNKAKHDTVPVGALIGGTVGAFVGGLLFAALIAIWYKNLDIKKAMWKEEHPKAPCGRNCFKGDDFFIQDDEPSRFDPNGSGDTRQTKPSRDLHSVQTNDSYNLEILRSESSVRGSSDKIHVITGDKNAIRPAYSLESFNTYRLPSRYRSNSSGFNMKVGGNFNPRSPSDTIEELEMNNIASTSSSGFDHGSGGQGACNALGIQVGRQPGVLRSDSDKSGSSKTTGSLSQGHGAYEQSIEFLSPRSTPPLPSSMSQARQDSNRAIALRSTPPPMVNIQSPGGRIKYTPPSQDTKPLNLIPKTSFGNVRGASEDGRVSQYWPDAHHISFDSRSKDRERSWDRRRLNRSGSSTSSGGRGVRLRPTRSAGHSRESSSTSREPRPNLVSILTKSNSSDQLRRQKSSGISRPSTDDQLSAGNRRTASQPEAPPSSLTADLPSIPPILSFEHPYVRAFSSTPGQGSTSHPTTFRHPSTPPLLRNQSDPQQETSLLKANDSSISHSKEDSYISNSSGSNSHGGGSEGNEFMRFLSNASKGKKQPPMLLTPEDSPTKDVANEALPRGGGQSDLEKNGSSEGTESDSGSRQELKQIRELYAQLSNEISSDPNGKQQTSEQLPPSTKQRHHHHQPNPTSKSPPPPKPLSRSSSIPRSPPPVSQFQIQRRLSRESATSASTITPRIGHRQDQTFGTETAQNRPVISHFSSYRTTPSPSLNLDTDEDKSKATQSVDRSERGFRSPLNDYTFGDDDFQIVYPSDEALASSHQVRRKRWLQEDAEDET